MGIGPIYPWDKYAYTLIHNADSLPIKKYNADRYSNLMLMFKFVVSIYLQYKFCVDGVWRHDENQPFSRGDYGLVNTIVVGREPDMINSTFGSQTPGRSNMDVDHDDVMPAVSEFLLYCYFFQNSA